MTVGGGFVDRKQTYLCLRPPPNVVAHCHLLPLLLFTTEYAMRWQRQGLEVGGWSGGHNRKRLLTLPLATACCSCLSSSTKPPSLLLPSTIVTLRCPPPSIKGWRWVVRFTFIVSHCRRQSLMVFVARLTLAVIRRQLLIILMPSATCFCYQSLTAANHSCKL
jgi:hypothetical protein